MKPLATNKATDNHDLQLDVGGMTCAACVASVEKTLRAIPGVRGVSVNLALEKAYISFDQEMLRPKDFVAPVLQSGYFVRQNEMRLEVPGLEESSPRERLLSLLQRRSGVTNVSVQPATNTVIITYLPHVEDPQDIIANLRKSGFSPTWQQATTTGGQHAAQVRLGAAILLSIPIWFGMLRMMGVPLPLWKDNAMVQMVFATMVQFGPGYGFIQRAWNNLKHRSTNMDVLVACSTLSAWAMSLWGMYTHGPLYFGMSATVITFVLLGKYLEAQAKNRAQDALGQLTRLSPTSAHLLRTDQVLDDVPVNTVSPGDTLLIRPGEYIPVDGLIVSGQALVDESLISGESQPLTKLCGQSVVAGSLHRGHQPFAVRAVEVGGHTLLAQIIQTVEKTQADRAPIQRLADQLASVFVPIVLAIALLTLLATGQWLRAVAVMMAACPCALGLATPTAILVASGVAAHQGILFSEGEALERAARIDTVLLDKTGTLTEGHPTIQDIVTWGSLSEDLALALAFKMESAVNHPLREAFSTVAPVVTDVVDVYEEPGLGLVGTWHNQEVLLGNRRLLAQYGVDNCPYDQDVPGTLVYLAVASTLEARFSLTDTIRPGAQALVRHLKRNGQEVMLVTGDRKESALEVARRLDIRQVHANMSPEQKAQWVKRLVHSGRRVAMVGDGVNDAPALAQAHLGISLGTRSDITTSAADVIILHANLQAVSETFSLTRQAVRKIRQNFAWALGYNALIIPLAALGKVPPIMAGMAMAFSSVLVITNALTLRRRPPS